MRIAYLIGQYPAINHGYLLREIQLLRELGVEVLAASVNPPDRPDDRLSPAEREAAAQTFYIKTQPLASTIHGTCFCIHLKMIKPMASAKS